MLSWNGEKILSMIPSDDDIFLNFPLSHKIIYLYRLAQILRRRQMTDVRRSTDA